MGKGKGGGGGSNQPSLRVPVGLVQGAAAETGLGQYGTSLLNPLAAMTGWASSLASNQNVVVPTPQEFAVQAGPSTLNKGSTGKSWETQFDPTTGLITFTNPGNPRQSFQSDLKGAAQRFDFPPQVLQQWQAAADAYKQYQAQTSGAPQPSTAQAGPQLDLAWQDIQAQQAATQQMPGIEAQTQAFINQVTPEAGKYSDLGSAQEATAQQLYGVGYNELSQADQQIVDANALVSMTTTGQGLFPAQAAMIEQARQSQETQLASTLGGAGLGRSTQLGQLTGAADLASAATAGQLQQGNIQAAEQVLAGALGQQAGAQKTIGLAQTQEQVAQQSFALSQAAEKLTLAGQTLLDTEQAQLTQELQNITSQSVQYQQVLWNEAMQGYGMMGTIIDGAGKNYGYSINAYQSVLQAATQIAGAQAQQAANAASADAQGTSSLLSGVGQLFGSASGLLGGGAAATGGAAGSLGVLGAAGEATGAITAGAGAAGTVGGLAGGGGLLAGVGGALTALFCEVAQEVYGFDNPRWERFRKWLLFRGPRWFLRWYGQNARHIATWLRDKPRVKKALRIVMDAIAH